MPTFSKPAAERLRKAHPLLQKVMNAAIKETSFTILDSQRGRAAQELAYRQKRSKARFGQSAHNWSPAIALDIAPLPINWKNTKPFVELSKVILRIAGEMNIPLRWGGDWNMNGKTSDERFIDMPHYELHKWRDFAKSAKPYEG